VQEMLIIFVCALRMNMMDIFICLIIKFLHTEMIRTL